VAASAAPVPAPAAAGGTWLAPVRDRYEVGGSATLVAYVGRGTPGWLDEGPYYGYLHEAGKAPGGPSPTGEPLGRLEIVETGASGWTALRVSVEVPLTGLAPGRYEVGYCNDPCRNGLGDLIGSRTINVGVDAAEPVVREWPLDEPLIAILAPAALVSGPGYLAPASEIRAGRVVAAPVVEPPLPAGPPTTIALPPTGRQSVPAPGPPATVDVVAAPLPPQLAPDPGPGRDSGSGSSPLALLLGALIAALCTGGVLQALRRLAAPMSYATWRYDGSSSTSSPTTHAPASSAPSS